MSSIQIIYGQVKNPRTADMLVNALRLTAIDGTLYLGYPVIASADEQIHVDALLSSRAHGVIGFQLVGETPRPEDEEAWARFRDEQDRLYFALESNLSRHDRLRAGRRLAVPVYVVTVFPLASLPPPQGENLYCNIDDIPEIIANLPASLDPRYATQLESALQRVSNIKPAKKRTAVKKPSSRGAIIQHIEREIANLDQWQKRAAIESPEGPQRIRGLAGSGKTVVLALKAAYLHASHPDWVITVTYYTRSLYQQFKDLIRRFSFEHLGDEPDWDKLRVLHAWGGRDRDGVYTQITDSCRAITRDFLYAKNTYGMQNAFSGVCDELLALTSGSAVEPLYDAVLIDEAQDLPPSFFRLVHRFTREPRRIVWAYDELQKLSESTMPSTEELFGLDEHGQPLVRLVNMDGQPHQDITLPLCYRNTPWALTLAHALGFGLYRPEGLVQHFDEPSVWTDIKYQARSGVLEPGQHVILERAPDSYPSYFPELLRPDDAVSFHGFANREQQAHWVATTISANLKEDELDHDDILIVLPDAYRAKSESALLIQVLARYGINAHLAGVTSSHDDIFIKNSIAIAHIHRSKGNEAPMVYVLDAQYAASGSDLITRRNILFTAITRSRAWVRLCGWGPDMARLIAEAQQVRDNQYRLEFKIPTAAQLDRMRRLHRDRTPEEKEKAKKAEQQTIDLITKLKRGDISKHDISSELRKQLASLLAGEDQSLDDIE